MIEFVDNKWSELTIIVNSIKLTFLYYPFEVKLEKTFELISLHSLEYLWAMKFYTLWRRSKWKYYIDIYFLFKSWYKLSELSKLASNIFSWAYNEKLLREQLCYYKDIDYSEVVEYELDNFVSDKEVKNYLIDIAKA